MTSNNPQTLFVTGISTNVGKTLVSAILVEALRADYWKPIQSGDLDSSDSHKIQALTTFNPVIHPNSYALKIPASPHAAASLENISIDINAIQPPQTQNTLIIEGAGGLLVPLNHKHTVLDLITPHYKVVVVSKHYLGSINHTLMTINTLKQRGLQVAGIIFNGDALPSTENIIQTMTNANIIGRIDNETIINTSVIAHYANLFRDKLLRL